MKTNKYKVFNLIIKNIHWLLLLVLLFFGFIYGLSFKIMNDGFWHIKVGEYIIKNHKIPYYDIFSWYGKSMNLKWISHEWLFGVLAYLVYSIHGFLGVSIFLGLITAATCMLMYIFVKLKSKSSIAALVCTSFFLVSLYNDVGIAFRPITISAFIILLLCIVLEKKKYILALLVLIVGINLHGGIYPIYIIIFAYYTLFKKYKYFIASLACVLVNPYTYNIYLYTVNAMKEISLEKAYINEWKVTSIYDYKASLMIIVVVAIIYALNKVKIKDLLFSGSIVILALSSNRHLIFLSLLALPFMSQYLVSALENCIRDFPYELKIWDRFRNIFTKEFIRIAVFVLIEAILIAPNISYTYNFFANKMPMFSLNNSDEPIKAVQYIKKHPEIEESHLLTHYNDSPYIIFEGIPSFVDSRADLFLPSYNKNTNAFYDFMKDIVDDYDPQALISKYKINYILINKSYGVYSTLNGYRNLSIVYDDENYCIFKVNFYE